jgi:hypothetical protein
MWRRMEVARIPPNPYAVEVMGNSLTTLVCIRLSTVQNVGRFKLRKGVIALVSC